MTESIDILVSLNQCINEWTNNIKIYITNLNDIGTYYLEKIWTDNVDLLQTIKIGITTDIVTTIDNIEYNHEILSRVSHAIIKEEIYGNDIAIIKDINANKLKYKETISAIYNGIIRGTMSFTTMLDIKIKHGSIIILNIIFNNINDNKTDNVELYKKYALNDGKQYKMPIDLHNLKKINYYIKPLLITNKSDNYFNINMSNNIISYDIMPLISRQHAIKFGPIHNMDNGIDAIMIERYKTILIDKKTTISPVAFTEEITGSAIVYTGSKFKQLDSVYSFSDKWKPLEGIDDTVYKYNELLSQNILENITLSYITIEKKSSDLSELYKRIKTGKSLGDNIVSFYFDKLEQFISNKSYIAQPIKDELYLYQYYNAIEGISTYKMNKTELIEIIPSKYIFSKFN